MSLWEDHSIGQKVLQILRNTPNVQPDHHFGTPFLTAYQIAIEFDIHHKDVVNALGRPLGGKGIGERNSFAQYIAGELSRRVNDMGLEGAFLSNWHQEELVFKNANEKLTSSLTDSQFCLSMFRIRSL